MNNITGNILDILPVGVFVLDSNFRVAIVNSCLLEFFGLKREGIIGEDKRILVQEKIHHLFENGNEFRSRVLATYVDNTYVEHFICHILPSETRKERWLEHTSEPINDGQYQGGRIEIYTDVTDRVLTEQEINWISTQFMRVQEKEKAKIASNLHDGLGQTILGLKITIEKLIESIKQHDDLVREKMELTKIALLIENIGREISNISSNLMPSMLEPLGLDETIIWLKDSYCSLHNLDICYNSFGVKGKRFPEEIEVAIFRVFQESMNNVVKHANADRVNLTLTYSHPKIIAKIEDNGMGFMPVNENLGTGLHIMKQRIAELNGKFKISSRVDRGTIIRIEIPNE
jgi:PAS domain S-box-containing protein